MRHHHLAVGSRSQERSASCCKLLLKWAQSVCCGCQLTTKTTTSCPAGGLVLSGARTVKPALLRSPYIILRWDKYCSARAVVKKKKEKRLTQKGQTSWNRLTDSHKASTMNSCIYGRPWMNGSVWAIDRRRRTQPTCVRSVQRFCSSCLQLLSVQRGRRSSVNQLQNDFLWLLHFWVTDAKPVNFSITSG